jgi:serine protease Do
MRYKMITRARRLRRLLRPCISAVMLMATLVLTHPGRGFADELGADRSETIGKLLPTVVSISVKKFQLPSSGTSGQSAASAAPDPESGIKYYGGSGFVIDPSGLIVTNYHVVEDAFEISVRFSDGTRLQGETLHASRVADLAVVKVRADHPLAATRWGDSDTLEVGEQVFVVGNPFGVGLSVSAGIVSALNRDLQDTPYDDYIQTDAALNHGNSGGPLFDMRGNVVGVDSELISPTHGSIGLGFAIPSRTARFVVDQLNAYGWVQPGWIGVKLQQFTQNLANAEGVTQPGGSIISWVIPNSPAAKAGLAIGDVILRFDDGTPGDTRAVLRDIAHAPVGSTLKLMVRRDGEEHSVPIVTEAWPRSQWEAQDAPLPVQEPKLKVPADLGLSLSAIDPNEKAKLGLTDGLDGVLVSRIASDAAAARLGVSAGDIILRVQNKTVGSPAEVQSGVDATRAEKRDYVQMLVLPKVRTSPGPKWVALPLGTAND